MNSSADIRARLDRAIHERFGEEIAVPGDVPHTDELTRILEHRSHRQYADRSVDEALLRLLFACALSAPSKSDLQQADIIRVADSARRQGIADLIPDMPWVREAPVFLVFCGNGRRLLKISAMREKTFANDHLDAFFNAAVDAAIVMTTFIRAATAVGLGCCPISVIRDHAEAVSRLLELPQRVIPVAGMCVGYPAQAGHISPRLPLAVTVHVDRYDETDLEQKVDRYDHRRHAQQPYANQRDLKRHGPAEFYGWSEDKARQYAQPQREDFGRYVRAQGFKLD
jgi:nitroreductase/FMN reductase [NAD(P)H]